ncbi:branched-chain amino acid ABC transporter substrate-binding protein [Variovorax sp. RB2P76]|uniref:branched-chain amino acid ABC transporter substrate-binding protein n=1 Tax=Variovorax sp. RB2P76 TaxID=3443736 RepID=UPI003F46C4FF
MNINFRALKQTRDAHHYLNACNTSTDQRAQRHFTIKVAVLWAMLAPAFVSTAGTAFAATASAGDLTGLSHQEIGGAIRVSMAPPATYIGSGGSSVLTDGEFEQASALRTEPSAPSGSLSSLAQNSASICSVSPGDTLTVKIGHVGPLTGLNGHLGQDNERGALLAVEELNRRCLRIGGRVLRLELIGLDDAGDPALAVQVARRLVTENVAGVVGHLNSATSISAAPVYAEAGIAQISPSATHPRFTRLGYSTTFRLLPDDFRVGVLLGQYAGAALAARRIVLIDDQTSYGKGVAAAFASGAQSSGARILRQHAVSKVPGDYTALVETLRQEAPELVFFGGVDTVAGPLIREISRAGLSFKIMGGDGMCTANMAYLAGADAVEGRVLCGEPGGVQPDHWPGIQDFAARMRARFEAPLQLYAPYTYDAVRVLVQAMVNSGSSRPAAYMPALARLRFEGVTGTIQFDESGNSRSSIITLFNYREGRRVAITVLR